MRPAATAPASVSLARRRALEVGLPVALGGYAAGTVLSAFNLPPLALGVGCLALGAVLVVTALVRGEPGLRTAHRAACGAAAAAWLAFAGTAAPWAWPAAALLVVAAAAAVWCYPRIIEREHRAQEEARRAALIARAQREQRRWPDLLARIGHPGVRFAGREDTQAGYVVHLQLPGSGKVTYSALVPATEKLEVAARLRHGSLRFERGDQAHKVILHVAERDVLGETIPFPVPEPDGADVLSIVNPIPVGLFEDGQVCAVTLREMATLIVGLRGSGKSNLLNVLLAQLSRCADVLIFAIDLKGGRMAAPWIEPWLDGRSPR
ncbi:MAG TPA: FtsK/SpoIIIE domain-containing protein, partial [Streptosporangiaceae bacterium]|nr:FtsK/SpoIIIE domain-containing protein [Streptosporangiaceae bacterium]